MLVAIGVSSFGERETVGCAECHAESANSRRVFLSWLKGHGLSGAPR